MITLYYSPGVCSLGAHIALEEAGATYERVEINLGKGAHKTPEYLAINPRGAVPALNTGARVLTENTAIQLWIARNFPDAKLMPQNDPDAEIEYIRMLSFLASSVHSAFSPIFAAGRMDNPQTQEDMRALGRMMVTRRAGELEQVLGGKDWFLGDFSTADSYALVFWRWAKGMDFPVQDWKIWTKHAERVLARPATQRALAAEGLLETA